MTDKPNSGGSRWWRSPRSRWLLGIPLGGVVMFLAGAAALGSFNWVVHQTSKNEFCYVCHSHAAFIRAEYEASSHFSNAAGVRADCADCHLPREWFPLLVTKIVVSADIVPELLGKLDTREKFEARRAEMAERVWAQFRANDSQFCRNCHAPAAMNPALQSKMAARLHQALPPGRTCIDCHRGLAHALPAAPAPQG